MIRTSPTSATLVSHRLPRLPRPVFFAAALLTGVVALAQEAAPAAPTPADTSPRPATPATGDTAAPASDDVVRLSKLEVKAQTGDDALTPLTSTQAKDDLAKIAGGTGFIDSKEVSRGRAASTADQLAFQPGVLAQAAGGNDSIKISIRGSAINRGNGFFRSGVYFQYDGLPITGAGGTPFELFEPLGLSYTEVLKGANGFRDGPTALGGSINWVTKTGYDASPAEIHLEGGSFGYVKGQLASGGVEGPFDYYASVIGSYRDGFQDYSNSTAARAIGNVGYRFLPKAETRLYYRFGYTSFQQPGLLTQAQINADPTQAQASNVALNAGRTQPGTHWVADKTTFVLDDDSVLSIGGVYHNYPIEIRRASSWDQEDLSGVLNYSRKDKIFDRPSETNFGIRYTTDIGGAWTRYNNTLGSPARGQVISRHTSDGSTDGAYTLSNDLHVTKELTLSTGLSVTHFIRDVATVFPVTAKWDHETFYFLPRAGLTYDVHPNLTVYGNISRTVEPPNSWSIPQQTGILKLYDQEATSYEVGLRPRIGIFEGSIGFFRSDVKNQLLSVLIAPGQTAESNASPTTLQGIEVGLDTTIWHEGAKDTDGRYRHSIVFRQAYTYNDFFYKNDAAWGSNRLPGVPQHLYQAELLYNHPSGFYAGFTTEAASKAYVDYANSYKSAGYMIVGAKAGYQSKSWDAYLDFRNLLDKRYASSISPTYNVAGADTARLYSGDGFGVFAGLTYRY